MTILSRVLEQRCALVSVSVSALCRLVDRRRRAFTTADPRRIHRQFVVVEPTAESTVPTCATADTLTCTMPSNSLAGVMVRGEIGPTKCAVQR